MKQLNKQQEKRIKAIYSEFDYLLDAVSHDIKAAYKFFKYDRDLSKRELELIILNYLHLYETDLKDRSFQSQVSNDFGLLGLVAGFERVRGIVGFDKLVNSLTEVHEIYMSTRGA